MNRKLSAVLILALISAAGIAGSPPTHEPKPAGTPEHPKAEKSDAAHWSYSDAKTGPSNWGDLSDDYILAEIGTSQSPVDISSKGAVHGVLPALTFSPSECAIEAVNNGHTIQFNCKGAGTLEINGESFTLLQFHFHAPSEHTMDGKSKPVEIHFVHANEVGQLAVVGVMLEGGASVNTTYETICSRLPENPGDQLINSQSTFTPYDLLPKGVAYFNYPGSLTTPPCSEGVRWFVLKEPVAVSDTQVRAFTDRYTGNNRPVQPLNARLVIVSDDN